MSKASQAQYYWCVKVPEHICPDKEIYLNADDAIVSFSGDLLFENKDKITVLALSKGNWHAFFAASCFDGAACYVEHWKGEVNRE